MTKQRAVIYTRVSKTEQDYERQVRELTAFAERCNLELVAGPFCEKISGVKVKKLDERKKVIELARQRKIDVVLVSESQRWGRSTSDLITTLLDMWSWGVCLKSLNGTSFDFSTASGKLMASIFASLAEYERDLIIERVKSGLNNARANGKILGRRPGKCPTLEKHGKVIEKHLADGRSIRWIAHELHIGTKTVQKAKNAMEVRA